MQPPKLIESASKVTGSEYKLAQALGVSRQNLSDWKRETRSCPADIRARMAAIAGLDPLAEMIEAIADSLSEDRKNGLLAVLTKAKKGVVNA